MTGAWLLSRAFLSRPAARLLGGALLTAAGALLGWSRTRELRRQAALLRELSDGLGLMAEELRVRRTPLPELFALLGDRPFFRLLHAGFGGEPTASLWRRAAGTLELDPEDRRVLAALAPVIGRYDAESQAAELLLARSRLDGRAGELDRALSGRARSFPGLGAALGAMLAVLLF